MNSKQGRVMEIREGNKLDQVALNQRVEELFVRLMQERNRWIAHYEKEAAQYERAGYKALVQRCIDNKMDEMVKKALITDIHNAVIRTINWVEEE